MSIPEDKYKELTANDEFILSQIALLHDNDYQGEWPDTPVWKEKVKTSATPGIFDKEGWAKRDKTARKWFKEHNKTLEELLWDIAFMSGAEVRFAADQWAEIRVTGEIENSKDEGDPDFITLEFETRVVCYDFTAGAIKTWALWQTRYNEHKQRKVF